MTERITISTDNTPDPANVNASVSEPVEKDGVTSVSVDPSNKPETPPAEEPAGERPGWLPEKFKTPEDLAKAYGELEKKQSQGGKKDDATPPEGDLKIPPEAEANAAEAEAGIDMDVLAQEYADNGGSLKDETYEKLEKAGFKRDQVDRYIKGQEALAQNLRNGLYDEAGGKEKFEAAMKWAATGLSKDERIVYNAMVDSGNLEGAKLAMRGLMAKYATAEGSEPNLVSGEGAPATAGAQSFRSNAEITKAMSDPRYKTDEAYRKEVAQRLAVTKWGTLG
jgi:hypothetical protein